MSRVFARRGERGAILVMSAVGVVLAIIAAGLAVDLGTLAQERRRDQKVADLAALDAVRDITNAQAIARQSATRNSLPTSADYQVTAVEGIKANGACVAQPGSGKVCVTVQSPHRNHFVPGNATIVARAVAAKDEWAGFTIGSSLASANLDNELPILNRVFERLIGASPGSVNLVSYQGLAAANITIRNLKAQMGFGTVNELLNANMTIGQLLNATATVLNNQGVAAATQVNQLSAVAMSTATFKLGDYLKITQGYEEKALDSELNVLQLITAGAELANKNNLIDAGSIINLPVPGVGTVATKLSVTVIEPAKHYVGPEGGPTPPLHTSQVTLTLTPQLDAPFTVTGTLGLPINVRLQGNLPVAHEAAGADGVLSDVRCNAPNQGITVGVTSQPVRTSTSTTLNLVVAGLAAGTVRVKPTQVNSTSLTSSVPFAWDAEFTPSAPSKQTGSVPPGISLSSSDVEVTVAGGLLGVNTGTILNAVLNPILNPTLNAVANRVASPALSALGISIGPVDVGAPREDFDPSVCGQPRLVQ